MHVGRALATCPRQANPWAHTHMRMHTHTFAHAHARTHARTHMGAHTRTQTDSATKQHTHKSRARHQCLPAPPQAAWQLTALARAGTTRAHLHDTQVAHSPCQGRHHPRTPARHPAPPPRKPPKMAAACKQRPRRPPHLCQHLFRV